MSNEFPVIPPEYADRAATPQMIEDAGIDLSPLQDGPKPIAVTMDAQEIGVFLVSGVTPDGYKQMILAKLKDAGADVEGTLRLRLAHGQLYKLRSLPGDMSFTYMWLPEAYVHSLNAIGGVA